MIKRIDNKKGLRPDSSILQLDHKKLSAYFYYTTFLISSRYCARKKFIFFRAPWSFLKKNDRKKIPIYIDLIIYVKKCDQIPGGINEN